MRDETKTVSEVAAQICDKLDIKYCNGDGWN